LCDWSSDVCSSDLAVQPRNRTAILRSAQIAHDRMVLAGLKRPDTEALPFAQQSAAQLERYLSTGPIEPAEAQQVVIAYMNVANRHMLADRLDDAIRMSMRTIEIAKATDQPAQVGAAEMVVASALRARGDLEESLDQIREAVRILEPPAGDARIVRSLIWASALSREGAILADPRGVSMNRPDDAIPILDRAVDITERVARQDPNESDSRLRLSFACLELGDILRDRDSARALAAYDHAIRRLAELPNNSKARRDEVHALAGSAFALRRLGREGDSRERLSAAFDRLRALKMYPAATVALGSEADDALRSRAEDEAASGDLEKAVDTYRQLLDAVTKAQPKVDTSLEEATLMSRLYASIAHTSRRAGRADEAAALDARRLSLWESWARKRPQSAFVASQLARARAPQPN